MNPLNAVAKALAWALEYGPKIANAGRSIARSMRKPAAARTWDRPHLWTVVDYNAQPWVYACQWCKVPRTAANETSVCEGPKI